MTLYPAFKCTFTVRIFWAIYWLVPCITPFPRSEASCAPASVEMLMLEPSDEPILAAISLTVQTDGAKEEPGKIALQKEVYPQKEEDGDLYHGLTKKLTFDRMIPPHGLEVTYDKTVHVIFPAAVRYVDLGSPNLIAGKADGAENVIRVKATVRDFRTETNMSVITEDGSFYTFNVK